MARDLGADVVLMDIRMPRVEGLEATRRIVADPELTGARILVVTTYETDEYIYAALRAGASGFLVKDTEPEELLHAVRVVPRGDALLPPTVTRTLIADIALRPQPRPPVAANALAELTEREREIVSLVAAGLSNEIAARLIVSPLTAKTPRDDQARRPRPRAARRPGLRDRPRRPRKPGALTQLTATPQHHHKLIESNRQAPPGSAARDSRHPGAVHPGGHWRGKTG